MNGLVRKARWSANGRWAGREWTAVRRSVHSAFEESGPERDTLVQSLKAAAAAIIAWALTGWWLQAPMALLAPWTAVALVSSTVYQSLRTGSQQFGIIVLGTVWASAAMAVTHDQTMAAMLLTLPFMTLLGNYRRFGSQGILGASTALFVITYGSSSASNVGHRLLETLIGAVVGIMVNALVLPPVHLRSVRDRLRRLARGSADLLDAMAHGLREDNAWEKAGNWHTEASRLSLSLQGVADARHWATEGARWNPGGRLRRTGPPPPPFTEDVRWGRVCTRILAVARTLNESGGDGRGLPTPPPCFLVELSDVLEQAARMCLEEAEHPASATDDRRRERAFDKAWVTHRALADNFQHQEGPAAAVGGALLLETRQLLMDLAPRP
ncbi:FUSC family protein [Streptomyces sp. NBC_00887]|uniref:FUSC family protein n=1 Tax=Streptomyces sp. NBC_00887 TaxID=2975859 RepID=UPI003867D0B4|nr:aromatic acid exporter family protein [Streptomyces sp. NBC_00887]WSY35750.1 aromatic acid exporter family protein [Streptomyces sp. NBC_00887]